MYIKQCSRKVIHIKPKYVYRTIFKGGYLYLTKTCVQINVETILKLEMLKNNVQYGCFESFPISILSKLCYFRPPDHVISMELLALNFRCQCTQQKLQSICAILAFDPQLKKNLTFSVKDRYQLLSPRQRSCEGI